MVAKSKLRQARRAFSLLLFLFAVPYAETASAIEEILYFPPPLGLFLLPPQPVFVCRIGGPCDDAPWTAQMLPALSLGEPVSISTSSTSFSFFLGNELDGVYRVTVSPHDDLVANIANRSFV